MWLDIFVVTLVFTKSIRLRCYAHDLNGTGERLQFMNTVIVLLRQWEDLLRSHGDLSSLAW